VLAGAVALGLGGILLMTVLVQYGVSNLPVHRSAVLALIELVAGAVSQQLLTDEVVTAHEWVGGGLILVGAWLSAQAPHSVGDARGVADRRAPGRAPES
jgi:drug/metabolite transporter (DMT)-like permease